MRMKQIFYVHKNFKKCRIKLKNDYIKNTNVSEYLLRCLLVVINR